MAPHRQLAGRSTGSDDRGYPPAPIRTGRPESSAVALRELIRMLSGWKTVVASSRCQWLGPSVLALLIFRYSSI
jgi:hypothetical protein